MLIRMHVLATAIVLMSCGAAPDEEIVPLLLGGKGESRSLELGPLDSKVLSLPCSNAMGCEFKARICITPLSQTDPGWLVGVRFGRDAVTSMQYVKTVYWNQPESGRACKFYERSLLDEVSRSGGIAYLRISSRVSVPLRVELDDLIISDKQTCWSPNDTGDMGPDAAITFQTQRRKFTFYTEVYERDFRPGDLGREGVFLHSPQDVDWYRAKVQPSTYPPLVTAAMSGWPAGGVYLLEMTYLCNDGTLSKLECIDGEASPDGRSCSSTSRVIAQADCTEGGKAYLRVSSRTWAPVCATFSLRIAVN